MTRKLSRNTRRAAVLAPALLVVGGAVLWVAADRVVRNSAEFSLGSNFAADMVGEYNRSASAHVTTVSEIPEAAMQATFERVQANVVDATLMQHARIAAAFVGFVGAALCWLVAGVQGVRMLRVRTARAKAAAAAIPVPAAEQEMVTFSRPAREASWA